MSIRLNYNILRNRKKMRHFIFYTTEGYTTAPDQTVLENCQILSFESATDAQNAWNIFTAKHSNLIKMGFSIENIVCKELIN